MPPAPSVRRHKKVQQHCLLSTPNRTWRFWDDLLTLPRPSSPPPPPNFINFMIFSWELDRNSNVMLSRWRVGCILLSITATLPEKMNSLKISQYSMITFTAKPYRSVPLLPPVTVEFGTLSVAVELVWILLTGTSSALLATWEVEKKFTNFPWRESSVWTLSPPVFCILPESESVRQPTANILSPEQTHSSFTDLETGQCNRAVEIRSTLRPAPFYSLSRSLWRSFHFQIICKTVSFLVVGRFNSFKFENWSTSNFGAACGDGIALRAVKIFLSPLSSTSARPYIYTLT